MKSPREDRAGIIRDNRHDEERKRRKRSVCVGRGGGESEGLETKRKKRVGAFAEQLEDTAGKGRISNQP